MSSLHSHPTNERLARVLAVRDLTDPNQGPHVMQQLVRELHDALAALWQCRRQLYPSPVLLTQNEGAPAIGDRTTPVAGDYLLRPTTGAVLPAMLTGLSLDPPDDLLVVCPGLTYRNHEAATHQLDLWRVRRGSLDAPQMAEAVRQLLKRALPGRAYRVLPAQRDHLRQAVDIAVRHENGWLHVGVCGLVEAELMEQCGVSADSHAVLSISLDLDELVTVRKGLPSRRLLRSDDPEVAAQMLDLEPYRPVNEAASLRESLTAGAS